MRSLFLTYLSPLRLDRRIRTIEKGVIPRSNECFVPGENDPRMACPAFRKVPPQHDRHVCGGNRTENSDQTSIPSRKNRIVPNEQKPMTGVGLPVVVRRSVATLISKGVP